MINKKSVKAVDDSMFGKHFTKPLYDSYCFSRIPHTILDIFGVDSKDGLPKDVLPSVKKYDRAVFLFVDAFGWKFFGENKDDYPSLKRFLDRGIVSKLTSQFPSTTPVHVTTINTALNVGEHGVYEWFYYEPKLDAVIAPLLFSFARDQERDTLKKVNAKAEKLYPKTNIYQKLNKYGVKSYIFSDSEYIKSPYNELVTTGATESFAWSTVAEAFVLLTSKLLKEKDKAYFYFYYGKVDSMGHKYGPDSKEFKAELDVYLTALERMFFNVLEGKLKNTIILLSADHGQIRLQPAKTVYLNRIIPNIEDYLIKTKSGKTIVPAGWCRDMFLHVKKEKVSELKGKLEKKLMGVAEIYETDELVAKRLFGEINPSREFMSRVGNMVILPYKKEAVWWYEKGVFEQNSLGHHGGLSKEEMEIPFLTLSM